MMHNMFAKSPKKPEHFHPMHKRSGSSKDGEWMTIGEFVAAEKARRKANG